MFSVSNCCEKNRHFRWNFFRCDKIYYELYYDTTIILTLTIFNLYFNTSYFLGTEKNLETNGSIGFPQWITKVNAHSIYSFLCDGFNVFRLQFSFFAFRGTHENQKRGPGGVRGVDTLLARGPERGKWSRRNPRRCPESPQTGAPEVVALVFFTKKNRF